MFKKLITNLPFNPSLLTQVSFYAKRLKQEESVRRLGFGFMALAMFIQMFAVLAPPQKSLAYSSDYIAPNGFSSKEQVLEAWDNPGSDIQNIYARFGVTRDMIINLSQPVTIRSNAADLWTTGRTSLSAVSKAGQIKQEYKNSEYSVTVGTSSLTTIYIRNLKAWDIVNPVNSYSAFEGVKTDGSKFWILMDCGNYTQVGPPLKPITVPSHNPLPPLDYPAVELRKTIDGGPRALKPGDTFSFSFEYRNSVPNSTPAENVVLTDTLDLTHFEILGPAGLPVSGNVLTYPIGTVAYTPNGFTKALTITVRLKTSLANGTSVCNAATLTSSNGGSSSSGGSGLCINVINPCPLDASIPSATDERCTKPVLACTLTTASLNRTTKEATLKTVVTSSNEALTTINGYTYDFGDGADLKNTVSGYTDTVKHTYKDGKYKANVKVAYTIGSGSAKTTGSASCNAEVETKPDQPLTPSKSAQNISQALNSEQTTGTKAKAGDIIEYTLNTHNSYDYDRANYSVTDDIKDILDYTNLDKAFLTSQGGSFDEATHTVNWSGQTVKANGDLALKFRVIVKDPVPSTNQPGVMSNSFDCVIGNKFGNEVSIPINCPIAKTAEYIASTLPNTGPGTSLLIGFTATVIIAYFFARSRLLGKELELVRAEYSMGGGF